MNKSSEVNYSKDEMIVLFTVLPSDKEKFS